MLLEVTERVQPEFHGRLKRPENLLQAHTGIYLCTYSRGSGEEPKIAQDFKDDLHSGSG